MRVVLYANDFEPITVIEIPHFAVEHLKEYGRVSLAVAMPVALNISRGEEPVQPAWLPKVEIRAEKLHFPNGEHLMLFTDNEEAALLLKASFLAGQRAELQNQRDNSFARGFLQALTLLGT